MPHDVLGIELKRCMRFYPMYNGIWCGVIKPSFHQGGWICFFLLFLLFLLDVPPLQSTYNKANEFYQWNYLRCANFNLNIMKTVWFIVKKYFSSSWIIIMKNVLGNSIFNFLYSLDVILYSTVLILPRLWLGKIKTVEYRMTSKE